MRPILPASTHRAAGKIPALTMFQGPPNGQTLGEALGLQIHPVGQQSKIVNRQIE
jgi:hypothetical protein